MLLIVRFSRFSYVLQNEQLLKFIQCDEVVPVVKPEEVDFQFYQLRSAKSLLMDGVCFDRVCTVSSNSFDEWNRFCGALLVVPVKLCCIY